MRRLEDKVCLITGGAGCIGSAMARRFHSEGAKIVLADRDGEKLAARQREPGAEEWLTILTDVSQESEVRDMMQSVEARFGRLDVLVNNAAGWERDGAVTDISGDDWDMVQTATLKSVFLCSKYALPMMIRQQQGSIINVSSVNALFGLALAAYTAAKGGVIALTRVMAVMHGPQGVRVNAISPGTIRTEGWKRLLEKDPLALEKWARRYPIGRVGTPEEVAALAAYLASDESANTTGANLTMDGGLSAGMSLSEYGPHAAEEERDD